jgi:hypothetical protein
MTADRAADLRDQAARSRLAALTRCCRLSTWARVMQRAVGDVRRLRDGATSDSAAARVCCA